MSNTWSQITFPDGSTSLIETAATATKRRRGLSGRDKCGAGMLFVFQETAFHPMWMHLMKFPLDIVWLLSTSFSVAGENLVVVDFFGNAQPCLGSANCPALGFRNAASTAVLELPIGSIEAHGLKVGSAVAIWEATP